MNLPEFLMQRPDGEIVVTGHRITLYHVIMRHLQKMTPEEIVDDLPTLNLAQVNGVIAFYRDKRSEVDRYIEQTRDELARQEALYGQRNSRQKLQARWAELYPGRPLPGAAE